MTSSRLTEKGSGWDYATSVARVKPLVVKWGTLTVDLLHELCQARAELSRTGTYPREGGANASPLKTWGRYCLDVGLTKSTVNRWLLRYDDETRTVQELPEPEPVKERAGDEPEVQAGHEPVVETDREKGPASTRRKLEPERQARVDEFMARMRREDAEAKERHEQNKPASNAEVDDILRRADEHLRELREAAERFSHLTLAGGADNQMQTSMLGLIRRYVLSFDTPARRSEVSHNLIKAIRLIIHEVNESDEGDGA